jgi:cytochrome c551/c552
MTHTAHREERTAQGEGRRGWGRVVAPLVAAGASACTLALGAGPASAAGDQETGRAVFAEKQCTRCHQPRGEAATGPALEDLRRPQGGMELAGRLWNHVPGMFAALAQARADWPRISTGEMADLMAYLLADAARDPAPDPSRGQLVLMRKGCLKCHSLAREGGRVEPDLAERRADYESAAAWAAAMWTHTPAMAAMAGRQGIPYPRFAGDEMGNLVGFLKQAATAAPRPSGSAPAR